MANLPDEERKQYERYLDNLHYQASIAETLKFEAEEKVREIERITIARMMKQNGEPITKIIQYTGLSSSEIEDL